MDFRTISNSCAILGALMFGFYLIFCITICLKWSQNIFGQPDRCLFLGFFTHTESIYYVIYSVLKSTYNF